MKRLSIGGYYGGKASMLRHLLPHVGIPHAVYCELFAGSLALLLNKPRARIEIVNDLAGEIATFWRVLRDRGDELIRVISLTPPGEASLKEILRAPPTDCEVEVARRFYVRTQLAYANIPTGATNTTAQSAIFAARKDNLPAVRARIAKVYVEHGDAARLIGRVVSLANSQCAQQGGAAAVLFYADPPYLPATRPAGANIYIEDPDGSDATDMHQRFLDAVLKASQLGARFLISGYASDLYDDTLTSGRGWRRFEISKAVCTPLRGVSAEPRRQRRATEILWRNYSPRPQRPAPDPLLQILRQRQ